MRSSRKKDNYIIKSNLYFGILGSCVVLLIVAHLTQGVSFDIIEVMFSSIVFFIITILIWRIFAHIRFRATHQKFMQKTKNIIKKHAPQLARRKAQLVQLDAYGRPKFEKWDKEVYTFIANHITPNLTKNEMYILASARTEISHLVSLYAESEIQRNNPFKEFSDDMTPSEFETFCAEQLNQFGWDARVTMRSRDQGVDVIAEKKGKRLVMQCKLYAKPVGNKAVQEIVAGKAHEQADYGAVVTNNYYTPAAEQLATTNNIYLLHYLDLKNLETLLG